ncbi:MAG: DUF6259 domain-containing protein [archaeon]
MNKKGQGAMEYLLLIGGAVLVATVVLILIIYTAPAGGGILNDALDGYDDIGLDDIGESTGPPPEDFVDEALLENDEVQFTFDETDTPAGDVILSLVTDESGNSFVTSGDALWTVIMTKPLSPGTPNITFSPNQGICDPVTLSQWKDGPTSFVELYWNNCFFVSGSTTEYANIRMRVELKDGESIGNWRLFLENHSSYGVQLVGFLFMVEPHDTTDKLFMPGVDGLLITNPTSTMPGFQQNLHIMFTQVQAWYNEGLDSGLYFATLDPRNSRSKYNRWENDGSSIQFTFGDYGEEPLTTKGWSAPYPVAFGVFHGDWYDAVQRYRDWVESKGVITSAGKLKNRADVPLWYKELGLQLIQNYSPDLLDTSQNSIAVDSFQAIKNYYLPCLEYHSNYPDLSVCTGNDASDQPLSFFQWNWSNNYFQNPGWSDPKPGGGSDGYGEYVMLQKITDFVTQMDAREIYMQFYTQPGIYSQGGPSFSSLSSQAIHNANEQILFTSPHPGEPTDQMVMDPASTTWHNYYANSAKTNVVGNLGHGIYMDNPYANYGINYSADTVTPPHLKGKGGTHFYEGYRNMMIITRNEAKEIDDQFILFHEQGMETYVGASDSFSNGGTNSPSSGYVQANVKNVPAMEVLYHDYQLFNSSNSNPDWSLGHYNFYQGDIPAYLESIQVNTAIGFSYGRMLNSAEPLAPQGQPNHIVGAQQMLPYTDFLKHLIKVRKSAAKEYLIYGQLLRPLPVFGGETPYTFKDVYGAGNNYTIDVPNVLSSVWEASDGSVGIVLINPTNTDRTITVPFNPSAYGVNGTYTELNMDNPTAHLSQVTFTKPFSGFTNLLIPKRSVRVIKAT